MYSATLNRIRPAWSLATLALLVAGTTLFKTVTSAAEPVPVILSFKTVLPEPGGKSPHIKYDLDPTAEKFVVVIPKEYKEQPGWGLITFIGGDGVWDRLPEGWEITLKQHKLLAIIPQNASNDQENGRRLGMAVLAAREMMHDHKIDPNRVYATGFSGGGRMSGMLGFYAPSIFKGTIQCCGADFYERVPPVTPRSPNDRTDTDYGYLPATPEEITAAKSGVKFFITTGSNDFRHAQIVDLVKGGFQKQGFNVKLVDVPNAPHQPCSGKLLGTGIDFLDGIAPTTAPAATTRPDPAGPLWSASDPKKWPQILAFNNGELTNGHGIGGSAFLLKVPSGEVVAATALHVFGEGTKAEDVDKLVKTWALSPPNNPKKKVTVKKLAITPDPDMPLDCLLINVPGSHSGLEPLVARLSPPQVGESLWVLGTSTDPKVGQIAYKVTVTERDEDKSEFHYVFEKDIDTNGFSGAPVMDEKGRAVGIHLAHGTTSDGKKFWVGVDIAAPVKQLTGKK